MTKAENELIERLINEVRQLREDNRIFSAKLESRVADVERKHVPVNLEQGILNSITDNIAQSIGKVMEGYNSPLTKLAESVVVKHTRMITDVLDGAMTEAVTSTELPKALNDAIAHKVARTLISGVDGMLDKVSTDLKQNPQFKAQATIAIANVVKAFATNA